MKPVVQLLVPDDLALRQAFLQILELKCQFYPHAYFQELERRLGIRCGIVDHLFSPDFKGNIWLALNSGKPMGYLSLEASPWDSKYMGKQVLKISNFEIFSQDESEIRLGARALLEACLAELKELGSTYCLTRVDASDPALMSALLECGFLQIETLLTFGARQQAMSVQLTSFQSPFKLQELAPSDLPWAASLSAVEVNPFDRFHADPALDGDKPEKFMRAWVNDGARGYCDANFKVMLNGVDAGFALWQKNETLAGKIKFWVPRLVLGAVASPMRGQGAYKTLCAEPAKIFFGQGAQAIEMSTQAENLGAVRAWKSLGLQLMQTQYSFRKISG
jgi:dTDP-4-amino-4,6-dideoxy-D-galactose acyltransferase